MTKAVVTLAGGDKYLPSAAVQALELRAIGCDWPHIVFTLPGEYLGRYHKFFLDHGSEVREVTGYEGHPWTAKTNAVVQAGAETVLFLDSDCLPLIDPDDLLEDDGFKLTGSMFWRDFGIANPDSRLWKFCGVEPQHEFEFEAGQILLNIPRCGDALETMLGFNKRWQEAYALTHGDKDVWRMAWHRSKTPWAWASPNISIYMDDTGAGRAIVQSLGDKPAFLHRVHSKFSLEGDNWFRTGVPNAARCLHHLEYLREYLSKQ